MFELWRRLRRCLGTLGHALRFLHRRSLGMTRRIATWNVNDVRKHLPLLLAWLEATRPDVVALQELKCTREAFPAGELAAAGWHDAAQQSSSLLKNMA